MPALARPDAEVRREILRLEMDARLAALKAEVAARSADGAVASGQAVESPEPTEGGDVPGPATVGQPPEPPESESSEPGGPPDPA